MSEDRTMPQQRLSKKRKGKAWRKQNLDAVDSNWGMYNNGLVRSYYRNKVINQNLYEGSVSKRDMAAYLNPYGIVGLEINKEVGHHNIIVPKIDLLVGEEINRDFDYTAIVTNPSALSDKQKAKSNYVINEVVKVIMNNNIPEDEVKQRLEEISKFSKYSFKDIKELTANRLLRHYSLEQDFEKTFSNGFKDALIMGEELYECSILDAEPYLMKLNPHKVFTIRDNTSSRIEDSDIIILEDYWSPGKILDVYYKSLKPKDIDRLANAKDWAGEDGRYDPTISALPPVMLPGNSVDSDVTHLVDDILQFSENEGYNNNSDRYVDDLGNIKVLKVLWRSQKLIKKVKYYDEFGDIQYKIRSEEYEVNEFLGEEAEVLWVNEWWEGTKIGVDIYVEMKPRDVQYTRMHSPSLGHPGIIGEVYNTNQGKVVSLVERMKGYQYLYDSIWDRLMKAIAKNLGKMMELDMAKIPGNWDVGKWLYYANTMGIAMVDSFKEGNKGASTGVLAGNYNTTGKILDAETGSYIQQHVQLLEFIKMEMSELAGITKQREGQISNRETVGGVERSVMQSSHITEWWFMKHESVKKRAITIFLETAKQALKGTNKKIQYILDDLSMQILEVDGNEFADADYGIVITSDKYTKQFRQSLVENAQAALQNQLIKYSDLFAIYSSSSFVEMRKTIEESEAKADEQRQIENEQNAQAAQAAQQQAQALLEFQEFVESTKLQIEQNRVLLEKYKIDIENGVNVDELTLKSAEIESNIENQNEELKLKTKELSEVVRHNKESEKIDMKKAASTNMTKNK